jgi:hypothetical protein
MEYYSTINDNKPRKIDGTVDYHIKQNKPDSERQISHIASHICNLDFFLKGMKVKEDY